MAATKVGPHFDPSQFHEILFLVSPDQVEAASRQSQAIGSCPLNSGEWNQALHEVPEQPMGATAHAHSHAQARAHARAPTIVDSFFIVANFSISFV